MESQQAFARSCAPCPPYVEQVSGGRLAPPPRRDVVSAGAEEGLKVLRHVLKYDHKDLELPNQSRSERQEEEKEERESERASEAGRVCWGVKLRTRFQVIPLTPR